MEKQIILEIDASDFVSTSLPLQNYADRSSIFLVVFVIQKHSLLQCNHNIYDEEFFATIHCFQEWRPKLKKNIFLL